jgi:hypothetical protein
VVTRDRRGWGQHERAGGGRRQATEVDFENLAASLRNDRSTGEVEDRDRDLAARARDRVLGGIDGLSSCFPDDDAARVGELVTESWIERDVERERAGQILIHRQVDGDDDVRGAGDRAGIANREHVRLRPRPGRQSREDRHEEDEDAAGKLVHEFRAGEHDRISAGPGSRSSTQ